MITLSENNIRLISVGLAILAKISFYITSFFSISGKSMSGMDFLNMIVSDADSKDIVKLWWVFLFPFVPIISALFAACSNGISKISGCILFIPFVVFMLIPKDGMELVSLSTGAFFYIIIAIAMIVLSFIEPKKKSS